MGIDVITLYDTGVIMSGMPYVCYMGIKHPLSLKTVPDMSVCLATGHDLCPIGLTCGEITLNSIYNEITFNKK